jgi:uncharacterized membrane protein YbhN (UPF0104 family)
MGDQVQTSNAIWPAIKWGVFLVVLAFVARHAWMLWNSLGPTPTHLNWSCLAVAAALSIVGWIPSACYWRWIMVRLGARAPWPQALRAYFCGALGKYLPGKAAVIVMRAALLKPVGVPSTTAALAVTHETLTFMWSGGITAILLYSSLVTHLPDWLDLPDDRPLLPLGLLAGWGTAGAVALTMLLVSHRLVRGYFGKPVAAADAESVGTEVASGPVHLSPGHALQATLTGGALFLAAWWIHGLTLGLTIYAVIGDRIAWSDWPFWTGAAAVALVGGFVVLFAPGGLGVREGLLLELLERQLGPREAVLVTVLWRGVALVGEIAAAGALYYGVKGVEESKRLEGAAGKS